MLGGDPRLEGVRRSLHRHRAAQRLGVEQALCLGDLVVVPAGAVLVGEQHEPTVADPRVAARVLEQHQREQRHQHGLVGPQPEHDPDEADGLARDVGAQQVGAGAGGVAGGEREVGRLRDGVEPVGQHGLRRGRRRGCRPRRSSSWRG